MKLSKSKLAMAKVINENGGWADDSVYAANDEGGIICGYSSKPIRRNTTPYHWSGSQRETWIRGIKTPQWHQCVLSREEYYHAYPKADADGWIEWKGGECPVGKNVTGDIKLACGEKFDTTDMAMWNWHIGNGNPRRIIAYRQHKPDAKPEFCESAMRSIPDTESNHTIEQLAQEYRNAKEYAVRLQKEAGEANAKADEALGNLERAGEALGLLIAIAKQEPEPELVITDWWDLLERDVIWFGGDDEQAAGEYSVLEVENGDYGGRRSVRIDTIGSDYWIDVTDDWEFIRRP